jgi:hypothetical protein
MVIATIDALELIVHVGLTAVAVVCTNSEPAAEDDAPPGVFVGVVNPLSIVHVFNWL